MEVVGATYEAAQGHRLDSQPAPSEEVGVDRQEVVRSTPSVVAPGRAGPQMSPSVVAQGVQEWVEEVVSLLSLHLTAKMCMQVRRRHCHEGWYW